jgi:hypothetical protein
VDGDAVLEAREIRIGRTDREPGQRCVIIDPIPSTRPPPPKDCLTGDCKQVHKVARRNVAMMRGSSPPGFER